MSNWYILDNNHKPVSKPVLEAAKWMENNPNRKRVAYDDLTDLNGDDVRVSTVFLGLDHGWNSKTPVLWETMIFGGIHDQGYQERYTSYQDALEGHQKAINFIKTGYNGETE
jgi:hypothetical protein